MVFASVLSLSEAKIAGPNISIVPYPGSMQHENCFAVTHDQPFQGLFTMRVNGETYHQDSIKRTMEIDPVYCYYNAGPHKLTIDLKVKSGFHEAARLEFRTNPAAQLFATLTPADEDAEEDDNLSTPAQYQSFCYNIVNTSSGTLKFSGLSQYTEDGAPPKNQGKGSETVAAGKTASSCFELRGWKKGDYILTGEIVDGNGNVVEKLSYTVKPRTMERPSAEPTSERM